MTYPLKLAGAQMPMIWGGDALHRLFNKNDGTQKIGESWEISTRPEGRSLVLNGPLAGQTLADVYAAWGARLSGREDFPLLIKLLDANDSLSIQVHPDDQDGIPGKTEAWVVLQAQPGAKLIYGLKPGTSAAAFESAIQNGQIEQAVSWREVSPGDVLFIPAGTVHAIGPGLVLYEVQQNSNTTYRLYDWGRVDASGNPRQLHLAQGLAVTHYGPAPVLPPAKPRTEDGAVIRRHIECFAFVLETVQLDGAWTLSPQGAMLCLTCTAGRGRVSGENGFDFSAGDSFVLPAALDTATIHGQASFALSFAPSQPLATGG